MADDSSDHISPNDADDPEDEITADMDEAAPENWIDIVIQDQAEKRRWIKTIIPLLQLRSKDSDPSGRVQLALDLLHIAACERLVRILGSDLPRIDAT
jgi:hypothetical protein